MRAAATRAWLLLGLCFLAACSSRRADFPFVDPEGRRLSVRRQVAEPFFRPRRGAVPSAAGRAFYLRYRDLSRPLVVRVLDAGGRLLAEAPLPASGGRTLRRLVALPPEAVAAAFSLHLPPGAAGSGGAANGEAAAEEILILESGLGTALRGFGAAGEERVLGTQIGGYAEGPGELFLSFGTVPGAAGGDWSLELDLEADPLAESAWGTDAPAEIPEVDLRFAAPPASLTVALAPVAGPQSQAFYAGVLPFRPSALTVSWACLPLRVTRVELSAPAGAGEAPLEADPEVMLRYDPGRWRNADFELFRWNRIPEILVFDTAGYAVQDRYFKRLAFFVEKKGFRGRLVSLAEVAHLHGYNAHDYRAEDLARFFSAAAAAPDPLSAEEERLLAILLTAGLLRDAPEGGYLPGRGALLSISRDSPPALRRHLLVHEGLHGVFFAFPSYRAECEAVWSGLSGAERDFWSLFFGYVGYDITDPLLLVNEFQAYVLQQPRRGLSYYFQVLTQERLLARYPERETEIRALVRLAADGLGPVYDRLERALWRSAALRGGEVSALRFPDPNREAAAGSGG